MPSLEQAKRRLERLRNELLDRSRRIPVDRLFIELRGVIDELPDFTLIVRQKKFFERSDDVRPDYSHLFVDYLSFRKSGKTITRFSNPRDVYKEHDAHLKYVVEESDNYLLICASRPEYEKYRAVLQEVTDIFVIYYHIYAFERLVKAAAARFRSEYKLASNESPNVDVLSDYLRGHYRVDFRLLSRSDMRRSMDDPAGLAQGSNDVRHFDEAHRNGLAEGAFERDGTIVYFSYLPIQYTREFKHREAQCLYIESQAEPIAEHIIRFAMTAIEYIGNKALTKQHSDLIEAIYALKGELETSIRSGALITYASRITFLKSRLRGICEAIKVSSLAHSVTIRLYNPFDRKLKVFSKVEEDTGKASAKERGAVSILDARTSLDAHTFLNNTRSVPSYIPDLTRTRLSAELARADFEGPKNTRTNSKSEICFAIWSSDLPIGTLNLESPHKHGFTGEEPFLGAVATNIGDLFSACENTLPPRSLAQTINVYELAHGAAGKVDAPVGEDHGQYGPILQAWSKFVEGFRKDIFPDQAQTISTGQFAERIEAVLRSGASPIENKPVPRVDLRYDPTRIKGYIADALELVVRSLTTNAVNYSVVAKDKISVQIEAPSSEGHAATFVMRYKSARGLIETDMLKLFGYAPIKRQDNSLRYGAFLMGYLVRALGGILYVKQPRARTPIGPLELLIRVPLGSEK
jgi:hypothetical protein